MRFATSRRLRTATAVPSFLPSSLPSHGAAARTGACTARARDDRRQRRHQRRSLLHRDPGPVEQGAGDVRPRLRGGQRQAPKPGVHASQGAARCVSVARLCLCRLGLQRAGLGGQGSHRGPRSAAPLLLVEARRAGRDLHHRTFDGRPHHDGDHRALSRGLSRRDADVRSAGGGGRLPQHRPLRHAGDVRGALSGHHRFTVRAQRRDGEQGEGGGRRGPGARVEVRAAVRPHGRAAARRARPLPPDRRRAEETCRRRAVRQSQPHLYRVRRRCGLQSFGETLHRVALRPRLRAAVCDADRAHFRSHAHDSHHVRLARARQRRDRVRSASGHRRKLRSVRRPVRRGRTATATSRRARPAMHSMRCSHGRATASGRPRESRSKGKRRGMSRIGFRLRLTHK